MNNTKLLMIGVKSKDANKPDFVELHEFEAYTKEEVLLKDGLYRYLYHPGE